jgi:class 3 adenylate cyclase
VAEETTVRTFLIADIRGYSRYTEECGDEAAAKVADVFAELVREEVEAHGGELLELRGDEALAVFSSARQSIRAAVEIQARVDESEVEPGLPLRVGIGIDSGEAVQLADGSFRGGALNIAARLCGRAHGGDVLISDATSRLAGRVTGLAYSDRGRVHLKNIPEPIRVFKVYSELDAGPAARWRPSVFSGRSKAGRGITWNVGIVVALIAAATAGAVVYLTSNDDAGGGTDTPRFADGQTTNQSSKSGLAALMPASLWGECKLQSVAEPNAEQTAVCLPDSGTPDRWELSTYPNAVALERAYESELRRRSNIKRDSGRCNAFFWGGERKWEHGPGKPGGRVFCYFDGDDAVMVWTHERLNQPTHHDLLAIAREGGSDHARLTRWWRPVHHLIGKTE